MSVKKSVQFKDSVLDVTVGNYLKGLTLVNIARNNPVLFDFTSSEAVLEFNVQGNLVSEIKFFGQDHLVALAAESRKLAVFDVRVGNNAMVEWAIPEAAVSDVESVSSKRTPLKEHWSSIAVGLNDTLLAAGTSRNHDSDIVFFELRKNQMLAQFTESHSDAITSLAFAESQSCLVSGSLDGLICCFDIKQSSEDGALQSVLNVEDPVRSVGLFGPSESCVLGIGCSEQLSLYDIESADCIAQYKQSISDTITRILSAQYNAQAQKLFVLSSTAQGEVQVSEANAQSLTVVQPGVVVHSDVVNSGGILSFTESGAAGNMITSSDDGTVKIWSAHTT